MGWGSLSRGEEGAVLSPVPFSRLVMSHSLRPHESQHTRPHVHHQLPEFTQTHVHRVRDAIQPSHPPSSPSPPAPNPSQCREWNYNGWKRRKNYIEKSNERKAILVERSYSELPSSQGKEANIIFYRTLAFRRKNCLYLAIILGTT